MNTNFVITFSNHTTDVHSSWLNAVIPFSLAIFIGVLSVIGKDGKNPN
jgi:hypothetical protein